VAVRRSPDRLKTFSNPTFSNAPRTPHAGFIVTAKPTKNRRSVIAVSHLPEFRHAPRASDALRSDLQNGPVQHNDTLFAKRIRERGQRMSHPIRQYRTHKDTAQLVKLVKRVEPGELAID
jgi:hypothetical protein